MFQVAIFKVLVSSSSFCEHHKRVRNFFRVREGLEIAFGVRMVFANKRKSTYKIFVSA